MAQNQAKIYDIYCDDEGLFKQDNYLSAYGNRDCMIVGDILIAKHDKYGEMVDLTNDDIDYIGNQIYTTFDHMQREIDILFPISYPYDNI